jgi:molecular chaperone GrpE (heat shock protein)
MRKKFIILGLTLLFTGGGMLGWVLFEKRKEQQDIAQYKLKYSSETDDYLKQYDQWLQLPPEERTQLPLVLDKDGNAKTKSQLQQEQQERLKADMDRLAAGEMGDYPFAEDFYGSNWREEVSKYKKRQELNEVIFTGSIVCASMGGAVISCFLLLGTARLIIRIFSGLGSLFAGIAEHLKSEKEINDDNSEIIVNSIENPPLPVGRKDNTNDQATDQSAKSELTAEQPENSEEEPITIQLPESDKQTEDSEESKPARKQEISCEQKKTTVPISKKEKVESETSAKSEIDFTNITEKQKPLDNTLEELTEQVSAIREYTAFQQNRLEKLQDGYDWNIIRTFCLRIIRCIDNLDTRISKLSELDMEATHLKEVRDELVFALESSGVEQFEPKIKSDYRGQEKYAEVIKSKQRCNDPKLSGKIANIIKPGYHYLINDETVKVIRPAQVRLFG